MASFEQRKAARAAWPIRKYVLSEEPLVDVRNPRSHAERMALIISLSSRMWELSGKETPSYTRSEMPGKMYRGHAKPS